MTSVGRSGLDRSGHPAFFVELESVRGIAALLVVLFHSINLRMANGEPLIQLSPSWDPGLFLQWMIRALANGHGAVILFFVLSGFVLKLSLDRKQDESLSLVLGFAWSRFFRLYPAVFVSISCAVLLFWTTGLTHSPRGGASFSRWSMLGDYALLKTEILGPLWTIQIELLAMPVILAGFLASRRFGPSALIALWLLLVALSFDTQWTAALNPYVPILSPLHCFLYGMLAASLPGFASRLTKRQADLGLFAAAAAFFGTPFIAGPPTPWGIVLTSIASGCICTLLAYGPCARARSLMKAPFVTLLGRLSFGIYLLHALFVFAASSLLVSLQPVLDHGFPREALAILVFCLVAGLSLPAALLIHHFVELPGRAAGQHIWAAMLGSTSDLTVTSSNGRRRVGRGETRTT